MVEQLHQGARGVDEVIAYLSAWYKWCPASRQDERSGIDGILECRKTKRKWTVEIKTDWRAASTGNVFIETMSVDGKNVLGWAYTSLAQLLVYYVPPLGKIYIASMAAIKARLPEWENQYDTRRIPNKGYDTVGLLIPIAVFERDCEPIIRVMNGWENGRILHNAL